MIEEFDEITEKARKFWEEIEGYSEHMIRNALSFLQEKFIQEHLRRNYEKGKARAGEDKDK